MKPEGRGFNYHPGQSFPLSLCEPNSISRANAHMVHGLKTSTSQYILSLNLLLNISATRPTFVINVTLPCTSTYSLPCNWHLHFPWPAPIWHCSSVGGAAVIKPKGRGLNSHPGSFPLSLCGPTYNINRANLLTWSMGKKLALHITLYLSICSKYKCYTANLCNKRNPSLYWTYLWITSISWQKPKQSG